MEVEKGPAGAGGGAMEDGGTTQRATSILLKFLSDGRPPGVYFGATCNNIAGLPPEWVRAGRWDCAPFFIDLPGPQEQVPILEYYKAKYNVEGTPKSMLGWSGAEIESVCRIASMMGRRVDEAERYIVPVSKTMEKEISALRKWAVGKTTPANTEFIIDNKRAIKF